MTFTVVSQNAYNNAEDYVTQTTNSVIANTGDAIIYKISYRNSGGVTVNSVVWGSQNLTLIDLESTGDLITAKYWVQATSSANTNLVATLSNYVLANHIILVYRPSSPASTVTLSAVQTKLIDSASTWSLPSVTLPTVSSGSLVLSFLDASAFEQDYDAFPATTWSPDTPLTTAVTIQNTNSYYINRTYLATTTGAGSNVICSWTRTPTDNQTMYLQSALYLIDSNTGGLTITNPSSATDGATSINFTGTGFGATSGTLKIRLKTNTSIFKTLPTSAWTDTSITANIVTGWKEKIVAGVGTQIFGVPLTSTNYALETLVTTSTSANATKNLTLNPPTGYQVFETTRLLANTTPTQSVLANCIIQDNMQWIAPSSVLANDGVTTVNFTWNSNGTFTCDSSAACSFNILAFDTVTHEISMQPINVKLYAVNATINLVGTYTNNPSSPICDYLYPAGNRTSASLVASYNFNTGDDTHTPKNGFSFETNSDVITAPAGQTEKGIPFTFTGQGSTLDVETIFERRFSFTALNKVWIHSRVFIPSNYKHRSILVCNITGDISTWAIGDPIVAADGSTAIVYGKTGQELRLEFAQNDLYSSTWTANITNTARTQTRASVRQQTWPSNNKLFAIWCDGYSTAGVNPSIIFESHSVSGLYSSAYFHVAVDNGPADGAHNEFTDFITASDLGKWMDIVYSMELSSALNVSDGKVGMYIKKSGASVYTQKINATGLPLWKRTGVTTAFSAGYLHGAQNSGYAVTTILTDSMFELYNAKPSFLP